MNHRPAAYVHTSCVTGPKPLQVEAGGEGVKELLHVLQRSATGAESSVVGVLGFEGTGKKSLLKALRREQAAGSSGQVGRKPEPYGAKKLPKMLCQLLRR